MSRFCVVIDALFPLRYIANMELLQGKETAARITGILHAKYQVHGYSVQLTAHKIFAVDATGQIDFGGGEYIAAGRTEIAPQRVRAEDTYQWWELGRGSYFVECNETLTLADDEIALIEPEDRLLRAGGWHAPLFVRGHLAPVEIVLQLNVAQLRVKENARFARVRLFRIITDRSMIRRSKAPAIVKSAKPIAKTKASARKR